MSKLVVSGLRCLETTDGFGNDQIYMIIFRGSINPLADVKVIGGKDTPWADMGTDKEHNLVAKDILVDDNYHTENTYIAAMLEQDVNIDILQELIWPKSWSSGLTTG
jgi:hypothetical protein